MAERELKHLTAGYADANAAPVHYIHFPAGFWIIERIACHLTAADGTAPATGCSMDVRQYRDEVPWIHYDGTIGATITTNSLIWEPQMTMEGGRDYLCFTFGNGTDADIGQVHVWVRRVAVYHEESSL